MDKPSATLSQRWSGGSIHQRLDPLPSSTLLYKAVNKPLQDLIV